MKQDSDLVTCLRTSNGALEEVGVRDSPGLLPFRN